MNWLNRFGQSGLNDMVETTSLWDKYAIALYWAFSTMTCVGYGDVVATNRTELVWCLVGMLVGAVAFGYVVGSVFGLMQTLDPQGSEYSTKMARVRRCLMLMTWLGRW